jgi:hypothetical protein
MATYPDPNAVLALIAEGRLPDDEVIVTFHRAKPYSVEMLALFLALLILVIFLNAKYVPVEGSPALWLRFISLFPLFVFLEMVRRHFNDRVVVKANVIEHHQGKLSLSLNVPVIDYSDIREIRINQSLFGRFCDFGDVAIGTSGTEGIEMTLRGAPSPHELRNLLEQLRAARSSGSSSETLNRD